MHASELVVASKFSNLDGATYFRYWTGFSNFDCGFVVFRIDHGVATDDFFGFYIGAVSNFAAR